MGEYKVVCASDSHGKHKQVSLPEGDIFIYSGDCTSMGYKHEVEDFLKWLKNKSRNYTYGSVFIAGNHDRSFDPKFRHLFGEIPGVGEGKPSWLVDMLNEYANPEYGVRYLENSYVQVKELKIWGSPVTPWFHGLSWAFNKYRGDDIYSVWETIPSDTDIVVTHGPVMGTLDYIPDQDVHVGCSDLARVLEAHQPKLHVSGHIHEAYGMTKNMGTIHINASICNHSYIPDNKPIAITITK
jgi:hypothetical protein